MTFHTLISTEINRRAISELRGERFNIRLSKLKISDKVGRDSEITGTNSRKVKHTKERE